MIMAISVIVILGTIMALSLALTSQTTKKMSQVYLYEQASLLAISAAEYSLFMIAKNGPCFSNYDDLNFQHNGIYNISITNRYIYTNPNPCGGAAFGSYTASASPDTNGTVIMDIAVSVPDNIGITSEPIRYFRRTIQKL